MEFQSLIRALKEDPTPHYANAIKEIKEFAKKKEIILN
jgi:hypothetical protein